MTECKDQKISSKEVALGGILLALTVMVLYAESLTPTGRLSLYALSSFFVSVIVIESGIRAGWLFYAGTSLLAFLLIPDKIGLLPYVFFFGLYGIIKSYTERTPRVMELLLKIAFFNLALVLAWIFAREMFLGKAALTLPKEIIFGKITIPIPIAVVILGLQVVFFIYDWVYSLFIQTYREKIRKALKR